MSDLKSVNFGMNKYCVPAVMSALTGRSTDECAAVITSINGRQEIKAVNVPDIIKAFKKLRFDIEEQPLSARTLFGMLNRLASKDGSYLIIVPKHIVAIKIEEGQIQICDNASKEPLDAHASARLTQQVDMVFKITQRAAPELVKTSVIVKKDTYLDRLDIRRVSRYANPVDDVEYSLGYIKYNSISELEQIINELAKIGEVVDSGTRR